MKKRTFLGKTTPQPHVLPRRTPRPRFGSSWTLLFSAPVLLFLGLSLSVPASLTPATQDSTLTVLRQVRVFAGDPEPKPKTCDEVDFNEMKLFPIIPDEIRSDKTEGCNPQSWNRRVFVFLTYKLLAMLNYFAGAVAIIATIYGGILYLTGFSGDATVKRAKSVIIGAYVGFAIVLLARLLVQGSFYLFGDTTNDLSEIYDKTSINR